MGEFTDWRQWRKPWVLIGVAVVALLGLWLRVAAPTLAETTATAKAKRTAAVSLSVTVAHSRQDSWPRWLAASGSIEAWEEASVGAEVNGLRLAEVRANVGDHVTRGQLLARFADETVVAELAQAEAAVEEAAAREAQAAANLGRSRSLIDTGALSAQDLDQFEVAARAANAQWKSAKARRDLAALLLQKTRVVAPDAGVISARAATTGAVVPAGTELFRLIRQSRLEWRAEIAEGNLAAVRPGVRVELTTAQGRAMTGKVRALSPKVDARNRTVLAYVDLPGADRYAAAGTFANGRFLLGDAPALTLPQSAVVLRDGLAYVFKLGKDDQVQRLRVVTGRRQADRIEILTGLAAGVRVVAAGAGFLNDADYVRVVSGPAL